MALITGLLALVGFIFVVVAFVGLIKPEILSQTSRVKAFWIPLAIGVVCLAVVAWLIPRDIEHVQSEEVSPETSNETSSSDTQN